jgi:hypothetical protein
MIGPLLLIAVDPIGRFLGVRQEILVPELFIWVHAGLQVFGVNVVGYGKSRISNIQRRGWTRANL